MTHDSDILDIDPTQPDAETRPLSDDLKTLRDDLDTLAADVAALGRNQVERVRASAADLARKGEDAARDVDDTLSVAVRDRPVQSLALAFFAGYVFSAIVR